MAQFTGAARTSYFRVTDEERYAQLMENVTAEETWTNIVTDKKTGEQHIYHGFGGYEPINIYEPLSKNDTKIKAAIENGETLYDDAGNEINIDDIPKYQNVFTKNRCIASVYDNNADIADTELLLKEIQKIIHPDDAFVYIETGHENLRYLTGFVAIVTKNEIRELNIESFIQDNLKDMLGPELSKLVKYTY